MQEDATNPPGSNQYSYRVPKLGMSILHSVFIQNGFCSSTVGHWPLKY